MAAVIYCETAKKLLFEILMLSTPVIFKKSCIYTSNFCTSLTSSLQLNSFQHLNPDSPKKCDKKDRLGKKSCKRKKEQMRN
jgi:hypothetical protein